MEPLSALERAVLDAIALQTKDGAEIIAHQIEHARVASRENTGAGFFTTLEVASELRLEQLASPIGFIEAAVSGLDHGMGFLLWLSEGKIFRLEGYANANEDTSKLDLTCVAFHSVVERP